MLVLCSCLSVALKVGACVQIDMECTMLDGRRADGRPATPASLLSCLTASTAPSAAGGGASCAGSRCGTARMRARPGSVASGTRSEGGAAVAARIAALEAELATARCERLALEERVAAASAEAMQCAEA